MLTLNLVAYDRMGLCNPVSEAAIGVALDQTDLKPGERAAELGCGNAALACLLAGRGLQVAAFDRGEAMVDLACRRVAREGLTDRVTVTAGEADTLAEAGAPWRLLAALGTTALSDFDRLAGWLAPGGWLLWGDLFWKRPPTPALLGVMGNPDYDDDAGWRRRAAEAGLETVDARVSPEAEWEAYRDAINQAVADWARENPDHPDRRLIELRASALSSLYGPAGRETIGFGLYLFRKPGADD